MVDSESVSCYRISTRIHSLGMSGVFESMKRLMEQISHRTTLVEPGIAKGETMSEPKPRHFVPVPREKYVYIIHDLATLHLRSDWESEKNRVDLADRLDELFTAADDPGPGAIPLDETDIKGLAKDIRAMTSGFSPPQIANIISSDIDPDWRDE